MDLNVVLLPPFLTEASILDRKPTAANLLKVFAKCIAAKGSEEEEKKAAKKEVGDVTIEGGDTEYNIKDSTK